MKSFLPLIAFVLIFSSCTAYRTGQTPDDVYYSPERAQDAYVRTDRRQERYRDDESYRDDRYLRMRVRNRYWSVLDDDYYAYNPYYYHYYNSSYYYNSPWSSHTYWNHCYNPYYTPVVAVRTPSNNRPRTYNLQVFDQKMSTPTQVNIKNQPMSRQTGTTPASGTTTRSGSENTSAGTFGRNTGSGSGKSTSSGSGSSSGSKGSGTGSTRRF